MDSRGNFIEGSATLIGEIILGSNNYIGHNSLIVGPIVIGSNNHISNSVTIGTVAEDEIFTTEEHIPSLKKPYSIRIGDNNIFREYMTVHRGLVSETIIGSNNYFMSRTHVSHDSLIEDYVKIADNVTMGGFTTIQRGSYLGLGCVLHQFSVIGEGCMIGMNATVNSQIRPGSLAVGQPARIIKPNLVGLERFGIRDASWWNDDALNFPDSYMRMMNKFELACRNRQVQREEVSSWRASILGERIIESFGD